MKVLLFALIALPFFFIATPSFAADPTCMPLYNGGVTDKQICPTPTPKTVPLPKINSVQQTKGGLPIYPATKNKSTPSTGPESWSLLALAPLAFFGFVLRNKAKT